MIGGLRIACRAERQQYANFCGAGLGSPALIWTPPASTPPASVSWKRLRLRRKNLQERGVRRTPAAPLTTSSRSGAYTLPVRLHDTATLALALKRGLSVATPSCRLVRD